MINEGTKFRPIFEDILIQITGMPTNFTDAILEGKKKRTVCLHLSCKQKSYGRDRSL